ncbi:MAG: hypothetical protein WCC90_19720, partial [Methylocella sp.]
NTPEATMQRVEAAERQLENARREAKKAFVNAGRDVSGMFAESVFVLRKTAERWRAEAKAEASKPPVSDPPKYESSKMAQARWWARLREEEESKLVPREPQDAEAREQAVIARFKASTPEQQAAMIVEAAARHRPLRGK